MLEDKFIGMLRQNVPLGYDVETDGLQWQKCNVCGYSLSDGIESVYVPVRHGGGANIDQPELFEQEVGRIIKDRTKPLVGWNLKFDRHMSLNHGIDLNYIDADAMVYEALLNEFRGSYSLESISSYYPSVPAKKGKELYAHIGGSFNIPANRNSMGHFWRLAGDDPIATSYAEGDTLTTIGIYKLQQRELYGQDLEYIADIETRLNKVLMKIERKGIKINEEKLAKLKEKIENLRIEAYAKLPIKESFEPTNIRSPKDLKEYFEFHDITDWPMTEKGNPSFVSQFLKQSEEGEIILQARKLDHFQSSFLDPIDQFIFNGRIYTNFNQTKSEIGGTKSGRLSCYKANLQQVPKRDKFLGALYREIFEPDEGYTFIEFDYSQAEPRLYACYSGEPELIEGYNSSPAIDMHSIAAKYMGIDRAKAKNLNLGMLYVMGRAKLAASLGISIDEATVIHRHWHQTFKNVSQFTKKAAKKAEERGFVKTILGRRARFPDPRFAYKAGNRIIQGGSADILKYKMLQIDTYIHDNALDDQIQMLVNIHDAILFQVRTDRLQEHILTLKNILEDVKSPPFNLAVPFTVDYHYGSDWKQASYGK